MVALEPSTRCKPSFMMGEERGRKGRLTWGGDNKHCLEPPWTTIHLTRITHGDLIDNCPLSQCFRETPRAYNCPFTIMGRVAGARTGM
jgi:hypothetical protein